MSNIVKGVQLRLRIGYNSDQFDYFPNSDCTKHLNIFLESDIVMQKHAVHFVKWNIEVEVPIGYVARLMTKQGYANTEGVGVCGEYIHQGSHNKRIRCYLRNYNNHAIYLKKGDVIGELVVFEQCDRPISFNFDTC